MKRIFCLILIVLILSIVKCSYASTSATWDPANFDSSFTLSNGNLTATKNTQNWANGRATIGKSSGKWYWEYHINQNVYHMVGIESGSCSTVDWTCADTYMWYGEVGNKVRNGTQFAYAASGYTTNDIVGVAWDADGGTIEFFKNGVSQGVAFTGISGTYYPVETALFVGDGVTVNFGATPFTYSVPAGFCAGVWDVCPGGASFNFGNWFPF